MILILLFQSFLKTWKKEQIVCSASFNLHLCFRTTVGDDIVLQIIYNALVQGSKALEILLDVFLQGKDVTNEITQAASQRKPIIVPQSNPIAALQSKPIVTQQSMQTIKEKVGTLGYCYFTNDIATMVAKCGLFSQIWCLF